MSFALLWAAATDIDSLVDTATDMDVCSKGARYPCSILDAVV
jgi:hypothetical protein